MRPNLLIVAVVSFVATMAPLATFMTLLQRNPEILGPKVIGLLLACSLFGLLGMLALVAEIVLRWRSTRID